VLRNVPTGIRGQAVGGAAFAARLLLAGVFIAAGVGKLLDPSGSRRALRACGVSEPLSGVGAVALPIAELATAAALLVEPSAAWGAVVTTHSPDDR
jgi:uncharacterized membrane protein YphA (DoxX/SURF4 family)